MRERFFTDPRKVYLISLDCAKALYSTRPPSEAYAERVARLLLMTAAHESGGFEWRRQVGSSGREMDYALTRGAYSLYQLETVNVENTLRKLNEKPELRARFDAWLTANAGFTLAEFTAADWPTRMTALARNDYAATAFCRASYLWHPESVPDTPEAQSLYAKRYHNTSAGRATAQHYLMAWTRHCIPALNDLVKA